MIHAIPTDTCYGLACDIHDEEGYQAIYELKWRPENKPLAMVVEDYDDIERFGIINEDQKEFLMDYPHPFTLITERIFHLPSYLDAHLYHKIAIRVADACIPYEDIRKKLSFPLFLTSANKSGEKECHTHKEVSAIFSTDDIIILGERSEWRPASDIFSFIGDTMEIIYHRHNH